MSWDKFSEIYRWEFDFLNPNQNRDIDFWIDTAKQYGGEILDIASGDGRITLPLIDAGFKLTAIDFSKKMIEKLNSLNSSHLNAKVADMRTFELGKKFDLIIVSYFSFQQLLTLNDQILCLNQIKKHLSPDGVLGIDIYPCVCEGTDKKKMQKIYSKEMGKNIIEMHSSHNIDRLNLIKTWNDKYYIYDKNHRMKDTFSNKIALKECSPNYMELLFKTTGFKIIKSFGSFDKKPVTPSSQNIIYLLKSN